MSPKQLASTMLSARLTKAIMVLIAALLLPVGAFADEGSVKLQFTQTDNYILIGSLVLGLLSVVVAAALRAKLIAQDPGDDAMQEVGAAIHEGAMAYLKKQLATMFPFVIILAALLFVSYMNKYGQSLALYLALSFILGVAASYIAGYFGMDMAVRANMRVAAAARTSFGKALETGFQAGGVSGLLTVGMGLMGATAIFLIFKGDAMKLLVGFGFGGSLAALFMRVGGGIYTKAADVGADLVGKVEAGIPEDDARNPAVIADNVGDNVGDCAGMAADVFESYEVTLVAAIVLGAATAAIFDQHTWMRLIMFALMARGVGILASIVGIFTMKGSDDIDSDPLVNIRKGFVTSALLALVGTFALSYFVMGGNMNPIRASKLSSFDEGQVMVFDQVKAIQAAVAKSDPDAKNDAKNVTADMVTKAYNAQVKKVADAKYKGDGSKVTAADLGDYGVIKDLKLDDKQNAPMLTNYLGQSADKRPEVRTKLDGYGLVDAADNSPIMNYAIGDIIEDQQSVKPTDPPKLLSIKDFLTKYGKDLKAFEVSIVSKPPAGGPQVPTTQKIWVGPITKSVLDALIKKVTAQPNAPKITVDESNAKQAYLLAGKDDKFVVGVEGFDIRQRLQTVGWNASIYKMSVDDAKKALEAAQKDPAKNKAPEQIAAQTSGLSFATAYWWKFFICVGFGILMAFAFEQLTDYYVSTHKKPVMEVASVSSAGPAPMIIQGFSLGMESSVFSLVAIVISLLAPLFLFPPLDYGGYILSFYGIALVGLGLLTTTGYILAMDTFGPISDNAQGVFEMSGAGHTNPEGAKAVQRLDAAGNTTKALTKGFAIATAVVAAVALFHSYVEEAHLPAAGLRLEIPQIFLGLLLGGAAPYLFGAFSINAVGRASFELINEVRRQFREDSGIMAGTSKPNYARCVAIVTAAAQRELLGPGILAIFLPVLVAFGFGIGQPLTTINGIQYNLTGAQALGGFLAGAILSGQLLAVMLANSGGIWDNSKKLIEDGMFGGKGSEAHKAGVVCDTVGDPFKDTAGPAMNPLIKVMNLVALLLAPVIITPYSTAISGGISAFALLMLIIAFAWSKRGSLAEGLQSTENS